MSPEQVLQLLGIIAPTVAFIVAIGVVGTIYSTRMKIKNGYPLEGMWGQSLKPELGEEGLERIKLLSQENAQLRAELGSIKDRMANVERIVTDSGYSLTHQIEALRTEKDKVQ